MLPDQPAIERWRAYLQIAGGTGVLLQGIALASMWLFHVPASFFQSAAFRWHVVATMGVAIVLIRLLAAVAFRCAVESRHVRRSGDGMRCLSLADDCPHRWLVVLHVRLHLRRFDRAVW